MIMKNEGGIILASVLGVCALFGVGVSEVSAPVAHSVETTVSGVSSKGTSNENSTKVPNQTLKNDLMSHYPTLEITDEALTSLACVKSDAPPFAFWAQGDTCYTGSTKEVKKYGKANVKMDGKITYVQLASVPAGAVLLKNN